MARTTLRSRGQLTVPRDIRRAANLAAGDRIDIELTEERILLRPLKKVDSSQRWFWTHEWQAGEREASADIAAGRVRRFDTDEELVAALETLDAELDQ